MNALALAPLLTLASIGAPDAVVVFPDRAQVTRTAQVQCGARVPVTFEGVPPLAAASSFRARITQGTIDGLRAESVTREKEFSPKVEALTKQLDALLLERGALDDAIARAHQAQRLSLQYSEVAVAQVSRELAAENPNTRAWQAAFDTALATGLAGAKSAAELNAKLRELARREEQLRRQLNEVRGAASKTSFTVEVLASCPSGTASLSLTYLVGGSSWTPVYEARADEAGSSVGGASQAHVDLSTFATVRQATGEDWSNVELVLSTAVPSQNATPPEPRTLMLSTTEKPPERTVLVSREENYKRADVGGSTKQSGGEERLQARAQGLSVQLALPEKSKVPGDNTPVRLFVGKSKLKATFALRTIPKLVPVAFRVAEVTNTGGWPLLPGRLDAFRTTGLVGRYQLERVAQGAPFDITFGVEDAIRVKRTIVQELNREAGLFNSKRRFTYGYQFEVSNFGKAPAEVLLADQLPVSEVNDVVVSVDEKSTAGYQVSDKEGIARWKVKLAAGEKKKIDFQYRVEVPSSYDSGGM